MYSGKSMKALVTGAGGFIGSHLCEALTEKGYNVRAFLRYNSKGSRGWLESSRHAGSMEFITGDIRDYDSVRSSVKGADIVFHLSSLIGIPYSYRSPLAYVKTNMEGAYNVLEAAREYGVKVIHTSTSEVYGTAKKVPIDENHPLQPQSPYSKCPKLRQTLSLSVTTHPSDFLLSLPDHLIPMDQGSLQGQ